MRCSSTVSLLSLVFATISALAGSWSPLPMPKYVDTEVRTNVSMRAWSTDIQKLCFELVFDASPSNNLEVAFGTDRNEDGNLSCQETGLIIGWDCGEWVIRNVPTGFRLTKAATSGIRKKLSVEMHINENGMPSSIAIRDEEAPLFQKALSPVPEWLFSPEWNLMSLTARGVQRPNERFEVITSSDGLIIYFR